jgi:hypothetical protein
MFLLKITFHLNLPFAFSHQCNIVATVTQLTPPRYTPWSWQYYRDYILYVVGGLRDFALYERGGWEKSSCTFAIHEHVLHV